MTIKKFFKKNGIVLKEETPTEPYTYADYIKVQLDNIKHSYHLGMMTEAEYKALCKTLNDSALELATSRLDKLEEMI